MATYVVKVALAACAVLLTACASGTSGSASSSVPSQSFDGLELMPDTRFAEVYMRPGADLSAYDTFGITPCQVAFRKNWMRDQNTSRMDLSSRVTQQDVDRIKDSLGAECEKFFREALEQAPPYTLVEQFENGEHVLVLRPSIVNLDISAPDVRSAGRERSYTTQSGQMTLVLELLDGTTGEIQVRIIDRRRSRDTGHMQWSNSVTNRADADRILRRWAGQLREGLDSVTVSPKAN